MSGAAHPWWRRGGYGLGLVGLVLMVLAARALVASHGELQQARALAEAGEVDAAIAHYRRSARWHVPGSPFVREALGALSDVAREAERAGDHERALLAWRSVRAAVMASRSFYVPHADRLAEANEHIAALMAADEPPPVDAGKSQVQLKEEHLALLRSAGQRPLLGWTLVLLVGFLTWVGSAFAFASRALDEEDRLVRREAWRWGGLVAAGLVLWLVGMAFA
jgi:hypothetical protein